MSEEHIPNLDTSISASTIIDTWILYDVHIHRVF